jgi:type IV pilus assembly protein PilF
MFKRFFYFAAFTIFIAGCSSTTPAPIVNQTTTPVCAKQPANIAAATANVQLGVAYLQQGDTERSKGKLLTALNEAPNWAPAQDAMGYFLETTGEPQQAEKYYKQAIAIDPAAGAPQNNYGTFLTRAKRYQEADQHFMLAVQDPTYLKTAEVYENAGLCAMQIPDDTKALGYFQKAVQQDPQRMASYLELGQIYFDQKNYTQAQQAFNQYNQLTKDPSAEALWLGIRLARAQNDNTTAGSYALILQSKYATSPETRLLRTQKNPNNQLKEIPPLKL